MLFRSRCAMAAGAWVRGLVSASVTGLLVLAGVTCVSAQGYPVKPITVIIPAPAGGPADIPARLMSDHIKNSLGQTLVIENVAGAGGSIGLTRAVRAPNDGHTILLGSWNSNVVSGAVYTLPYDAVKDLEPVVPLTSAPMWLVGRGAFPAKDIRELVTWLKANPDQATAAMVGAGTASHVCGIHVQNQTGTKFRFVPYRGGGPAYADLAAGHVDLMCAESSATRTLVSGGNIKPFAIMSKTRWHGAPDVPTADELGIPGLHIAFWHAIWAPKGTPKDVIAKLSKAFADAMADEAITKKLHELGLQLPPAGERTPEGLAALQKTEIERWWPVIKAANIKVE